MTLKINKRQYKFDAKLNKEIEDIRQQVVNVASESQKQKSVVVAKTINSKIPENIFHIDRDGNVWIKTSAGIKQIQFV